VRSLTSSIDAFLLPSRAPRARLGRCWTTAHAPNRLTSRTRAARSRVGVLWERPQERARSTLLEPDLSRCLVCGCGRPISPAFAPSRRSGQECDLFGQVVQYDPRGARILRTVAWGDCGATGGFSCRDPGQLEWPSSGGRLRRLRRWRRRLLFSLFLPADGCVWQVLGADLAAAGWAAPMGVRRRASLLLAGS
jgi:hypothetical protein